MGLISYWDNKVTTLAKRMKWFDFSLLKLSVFAFTLFLVTVWPAFNGWVMSIAWYWWLALGIIAAAPLFKKMF